MTPGQELYMTYMLSHANFGPAATWNSLHNDQRSGWEALATRVQPANLWIALSEREPRAEDSDKNGHVDYASTNKHGAGPMGLRAPWRWQDVKQNYSYFTHWKKADPVPATKDPFEEWWKTNGKQQNCDAAMKALAKDAWNAALNHLGKEKA